jgi:hypothetical protein
MAFATDFLCSIIPTRTEKLNIHYQQSPMEVEKTYDGVMPGASKGIVCDTAITTSVPCSLRHHASHLVFGGPQPFSPLREENA